jgi:hypothetical protein
LVSATGVAFNVGLAYSNLANISGLKFAVVMKNIGPKMSFDGSGLLVDAEALGYTRDPEKYKIDPASFELPSTLELGLGYEMNINEQNNIQVATSFTNANYWGDAYKIGGEYGYNDLFFVRLGYQVTPELPVRKNTFRLSAGFGINYDLGDLNLKLDYGYQDVDPLDDNHVFTVMFGF